MRNALRTRIAISLLLSLLLSVTTSSYISAEARFVSVPRTPRHSHVVVYHKKSGRHGTHATPKQGTHHRTVSHHGRHHHRTVTASRSRHAYPLDFFMVHAPEFDRSSLPSDQAEAVRRAFDAGTADKYPARMLVRAGLTPYHPLHGGIFWRREPIKYVIVHSTETGVPQCATRVIDAWGSLGRRHAGAQYVVDRDGTIWCAVDPDLATVHVNIFKTLPGINNDNSVGIEMCHAGHQTYPPEQVAAVTKLVTYLQNRYKVVNENVITHRYAQQGDHTDPVAFNWEGFLSNKNRFRSIAITRTLDAIAKDAENNWINDYPVASTYLQIHGKLPIPKDLSALKPAARVIPEASPPPVAPPTVQTAAAPPTPAPEPTRAPSTPARLRGQIEIDPKAATLLNASEPEAVP